jgi:hypothetical protein
MQYPDTFDIGHDTDCGALEASDAVSTEWFQMDVDAANDVQKENERGYGEKNAMQLAKLNG